MGGGSPRFRRDLEAASVEADGVVYVEVTDQRSGKAFRFYDFEHTVALALDGRPLGEVAQQLREIELDLSEDQLAAFAEQLAALGFLDEGDEGAAANDVRAAGDEPSISSLPSPPADELPGPDDLDNVDGRIFGPLDADESGYFGGPRIGEPVAATAADAPADRASEPAESLSDLFDDAPAGATARSTAAPAATSTTSDLPAARSGRTPAPLLQPGRTPAPLSLQAAAARRAGGTPAPETIGVGPGGLRVDRTLTSFPPELLPADWLSTPAPEVLPGDKGEGDDSDAAIDLPAAAAASETEARPEKNGTPAPVAPAAPLPAGAANTPRPVTAPAGPTGPAIAEPQRAEITAKLETAAGKPAPDQKDDRKEGTPPPIPLAALASKTQPPVVHEPFSLDPSDDALTAERPVIAFPDLPVKLAPELDDLPAPAERGNAAAAKASTPAPVITAAASTVPTTPAPIAFPPLGAPPSSATASAEATDIEIARPSAGELGKSARPEGDHDAHGDAFGEPHAGSAVEPSEADTPRASNPHQELRASRERPTRELHAVPGDGGGNAAAGGPLPAPGRAAAPPAAAAELDPGDAELGDEARGGRKAWLAYAALGIAAAFVISFMIFRFVGSSDAPAVAVRTMVPAPTTVYRYWDGTAKVELAKATPLGIPADGKIAEVIAEGSKFAGGDILALLESGRRFRLDHTRASERLVYYQGMLEKMTAEGNRPEMRQAELKIAEKKRLIDEAKMKMAEHALVATEPGEAAEVLVKVGDQVKAGAPILRTKGSNLRAVFELPRDKGDKARQLGFCRAEVIEAGNKPLDCSLSAEGGDETHVAIDLPADPSVTEGKTLRLARDKLDAVFTVPAGALAAGSDRLFVVGPSGRAELRAVSVAERTATEAIITQGIDVGDQVIVDPPADLRHETRVLPTSR